MKTIEVYECSHCGKLHKVDSDKYVKVCGSVYIGNDGGLVNPEDCMILCRGDCFKDVFEDALKNEYEINLRLH